MHVQGLCVPELGAKRSFIITRFFRDTSTGYHSKVLRLKSECLGSRTKMPRSKVAKVHYNNRFDPKAHYVVSR